MKCHMRSLCPKIWILGIFPENCQLSKADKKKKMTVYCLLQAKHTTAKSWRSITKPSLQLCQSLSPVEKLPFKIKGKYSLFEKIWAGFLSFPEGERVRETFWLWPYGVTRHLVIYFLSLVYLLLYTWCYWTVTSDDALLCIYYRHLTCSWLFCIYCNCLLYVYNRIHFKCMQ